MSNKLMILAMNTSDSCFASGYNFDAFVNDFCNYLDSCVSMHLSSNNDSLSHNKSLIKIKCFVQFTIDRNTIRKLLGDILGETTGCDRVESDIIDIQITDDYVFSFKFQIINLV